jgi:hypothetical protein
MFKIQDIRSLETSSAIPSQLSTKFGEMILNSKHLVAKVETVNNETGEYRIVLQGTLTKEAIK